MNQPLKVRLGVKLVWVTIGISVLAALGNVWTGAISTEVFVGSIVIYGLVCIIPYKLDQGSNAARWVYAILVIMSFILLLGGAGSELPEFDVIATVISIPIQFYSLFLLFHNESKAWFTNKKSHITRCSS